ncbi:hypothetical protein RIF29_41786 [Crotalaria pallida]|uniref:CDC20/Fizzy WD40 domain-containing protein n=1 Tax=Crotalaria pallida TaxID=3830 RepID=A0AAN9HPQ4_CROPI
MFVFVQWKGFVSQFQIMNKLRSSGRNAGENYDRFIPNRSATDFDYARFVLTERNQNPGGASSTSQLPWIDSYRRHLAEAYNMERPRILAFRNKPHALAEPIPKHIQSPPPSPPSSPPPSKTRICDWVLEAPNIMDDFSLNLLDWGSCNVLCVALGNKAFLWNALDSTTTKLVTVEEKDGPIASVSWAPNGRHLAIGLSSSHVQLWDSVSLKLLKTLRGRHEGLVGSLAWNKQILTTGGRDGKIVNNDVREGSQVGTYRGHQQEVCGLKWSSTGQLLASGGNDNFVHIWDRSMSSLNSATGSLHRLEHRGPVRALAWCPFERNLLASGGGIGDECIKFWNNSGMCRNSFETGSEVCALLWDKNAHQLLSSHGSRHNQLSLWKYPSMVNRQNFNGHDSRVLFMTLSPDECTVASAAGDESIQFWEIFGKPEASKPPFAHSNCIR